MKALLIATVLLFSLRAMSSEVGEDQKSDCQFADQGKREAKAIVINEEVKKEKEESKTVAK